MLGSNISKIIIKAAIAMEQDIAFSHIKASYSLNLRRSTLPATTAIIKMGIGTLKWNVRKIRIVDITA